jgi:hypothetical protein
VRARQTPMARNGASTRGSRERAARLVA